MSQSSISLTLLSSQAGAGQAQPNDGSKGRADGFQALLDIGGADVTSTTPADSRKDSHGADNQRKEEDVSVVADNGKEQVRESAPRSSQEKDARNERQVSSAQKANQQKEDVAARNDNNASQASDKQAVKAENKSADTAEKVADNNETAAKPVADNSVRSTEEVGNTQEKITAQVEPLRSTVYELLAKLSGKPVTDFTSAQQALAALSQTAQSGQQNTVQNSAQAISPQLITQLQSLVNTLQALSNPSATQLQQLTDIDIAGFLNSVSKVSGDEGLKTSQGSVDKAFIAQLAEEIRGLSKALESFAKRSSGVQNNQQGTGDTLLQADVKPADGEKLDKPANLSLLSKIGAEQNTQQAQTKTEGSNAQVTGLQSAAAKVEANLTKSGGFDFSGNKQDASQLAGLTRTSAQLTKESSQTSPAFSRLVQQGSAKPIIDQIVFQIRTAPQGGNSRIHIQLNPADLGKLEIKMDVDSAGKTGITVTADNKQTLELLQRDSRGLERALEDAGLTADSGDLNFNLRGEGQGQQDQEQAGKSKLYPAVPAEETPLPTDILGQTHALDVVEGLDIKI